MRNFLTLSMLLVALSLAWLDWNYIRNHSNHALFSLQNQKILEKTQTSKVIISCETNLPNQISPASMGGKVTEKAKNSTLLLDKNSYTFIEKKCQLIRFNEKEKIFMVASYPLQNTLLSQPQNQKWQRFTLTDYIHTKSTANTNPSIWFHWLPSKNPNQEIPLLAKIIQSIGNERVHLSCHKKGSLGSHGFIDEILPANKIVVLFPQSSVLHFLSQLKLLPFIISQSHTIAIPINENAMNNNNLNRLFSIQKQGYTVWLLPYGPELFYHASDGEGK